MFTGLVEGLAGVRRVIPEIAGLRLEIVRPVTLPSLGPTDHCQIGDSIALNGCCLTVVAIENGVWSFQAGEETLSRTNLGRLVPGDVVNIEHSLPVTSRLGGHFVQGHVDGLGTVAAIDRSGDWVTMAFSVDPKLAAQMVPKGSVAVDGVSLTLVTVTDTRFTIALIPHTLDVTTLGRRKVDDVVNIETDILGKYVQKFLGRAEG